MEYNLISFEVEQKIKKEIKELFEFDIIEKLINLGKVEEKSSKYKLIHEGMSLRVTEQLFPKIFKLIAETLDKLDFRDDVEFFITNSSDTNAYAIPKRFDKDSHIVVISSEIIKHFDEEELKFIIGHEIGHLISGYSKISRIISFVYPNSADIPPVIKHKLSFWNKLAELTADRYGFIASPNIEKVISVFFKLSSGLDTGKVSFNYQVYLKEISDIIDKYLDEPTIALGSHPINPIRIKALEYFSNSKLYKNISQKKSVKPDKELQKKVSEIANLMTVLSDSPLDRLRSIFLATAGIIIAMADNEFSEFEHAKIIKVLGNFQTFPNKFLKKIIESENIVDIFNDAISNILKYNPGERYLMLDYLIDIILADYQIKEEEIDILFKIGTVQLGILEKEIAQAISKKVQKEFIPKYFYE